VKIKVGTKVFEVKKKSKDRYVINGQEYHVDSESQAPSRYSLLVDGHSHEVSVYGNEHKLTVCTQSEMVTVLLADPEHPDALSNETEGISEALIQSPMPGRVVGLKVSPGQAVKKGDTILLLEAMKMENEFQAPIDGTVIEVYVAVGDEVEAEQALVKIE